MQVCGVIHGTCADLNTLRDSIQISFTLAIIISPIKQSNNGFYLNSRHTSPGVDRCWEDRAIHHECGAFVFLQLDWIFQPYYCGSWLPASLVSTPNTQKSSQRLWTHLHCSKRVSLSWKSAWTTFSLAVHRKTPIRYTPSRLDNWSKQHPQTSVIHQSKTL